MVIFASLHTALHSKMSIEMMVVNLCLLTLIIHIYIYKLIHILH